MNDDLFVECQGRLKRTWLAMEEKDFDFLLVYAGGKREMQRMDGVRYLTGYSGLGDHSLLLVRKQEMPILYVNPPDVSDIAKEEAVLGEVIGEEDFVPRAVHDLKARKPGNGRIGFVGQEFMPAGLFQKLSGQITGSLCVDHDFLKRVGRSKTPWEIERIQRAHRMADAGFLHMVEVAKPGMREFELSAELERALRMQGARDNFGLVASSKHNPAIRPPTDKKLETGDLIIAEISPECDGYFAQLCRTIVLGEPSEILREKFELLKVALRKGIQAASPGAPAVEVARAINRILEEAGYEAYCKPPYMRSRGHGLGQGSPFPGNLSEEDGVVLEEGMTFIIHPNQYIPETGYLMLGETCEVTQNGGKSFSSLAQDIFSTHGI